ncbi:MAG: 5'-3' exonuclease H3TH domain-containing protein [bacterium]|nr:5'-3' exonuclease H3TH domain-containing protein [bacterium]
MKTLLLIDSHALLHRFFHALPPFTSPSGEPVGAIYGLAGVLIKIFNSPANPEQSFSTVMQKPDYIAAALDRPEPTFREREFKEYKIQRPPAEDILVKQIIKMPEIFDLFGIKKFSQAGFEADDIIGTLVEKFKDESDLKIIIVSGDLDILQLVEDNKVVAQISKKGISEVIIYNEEAVMGRYGLKPKQLPDLKGFLGDASDNIPGIKNIGPKTATPLVREFGSVEEIFDSLAIVPPKIAQKLEGHREDAIFSKRLATIRRDVPLECSLEDLKTQPLDKEKLAAYFAKLGFKSLVERVKIS